MKIKVLVVDDSALIRQVLKEIIDQQDDMETVGAAPDPIKARDMIKALRPDVLTLDVEMPRMGGLDFLEKLMRLRPMPVVMISSLTEAGSETTLRALELGAVDYIAKPRLDIARGMRDYAELIAEKIRAAARAKAARRTIARPEAAPEARQVKPLGAASAGKVVLIGASTGGTEAIREVLAALPADFPPVLVVQHMPENFTRAFAKRLDGLCRVAVKEAGDGEPILPGHAYIAPGHSHLLLRRAGAGFVAQLGHGPEVNRHRPSVDALFNSAVEAAGRNAVGVLLTGMGKDGAAGLLGLRQAGAHTIAQDEGSCVVFGMPREAIALGGASEVVPLKDIAGRLAQRLAGGA